MKVQKFRTAICRSTREPVYRRRLKLTREGLAQSNWRGSSAAKRCAGALACLRCVASSAKAFIGARCRCMGCVPKLEVFVTVLGFAFVKHCIMMNRVRAWRPIKTTLSSVYVCALNMLFVYTVVYKVWFQTSVVFCKLLISLDAMVRCICDSTLPTSLGPAAKGCPSSSEYTLLQLRLSD